PALDFAAGPPAGDRVRPPHGPPRRRARGAAQLRRRRRDRRPGDRGGVLLARGAGAAGDGLRHALPAEPPRARVAAQPGPRPRRRRQDPGVLSEVSVQQFKLPDLGEGLTEGDILKWTVAVGDVV